jgi:hypothetical protein
MYKIAFSLARSNYSHKNFEPNGFVSLVLVTEMLRAGSMGAAGSLGPTKILLAGICRDSIFPSRKVECIIL